MYVIIRRFSRMRRIAEAARRAESGIGQLLKRSPGFRGYFVFDGGDGVAGSVTLFETREDATAANEKALAWIRASLADLIAGEPDTTCGEVLVSLLPEPPETDENPWPEILWSATPTAGTYDSGQPR